MPFLAGQILRAADLAELLPVGTNYAPVNSNVTVGNGTLTARYMLVGQMCHVWWFLDCGSTSAFPGNVSIGLPFPVHGSAQCVLVGDYRKTGSRSTAVMAVAGSGDTLAGLRWSGSGNGGLVNGTQPHTIGNTDKLRVSGVYEIA